MAKKKVRKFQPAVRKDTWTNEDKSQISLIIGSDEYEEYMRDHADKGAAVDFDDENYVVADAGKAVVDFKSGSRVDKRSDEAQVYKDNTPGVQAGKEALAAMRARRLAGDFSVMDRKYRNHMSKEVQIPNVRSAAMDIAAQTEDTEDDVRAARIRSCEDIPEPVYDDGITADEFVPKALRKFEF